MPAEYFTAPGRLYPLTIFAGLLAATGYFLPLPGMLAGLLLVIGFSIYFWLPLCIRSWGESILIGWLFAFSFHATAIYWMFEVVLLFGTAGRLFGVLLVFIYVSGISISGALVLAIVRAFPERLRARVILYAGPVLVVLSWSLIHRGIFGFPWFAFGEWLLDSPLSHWLVILGANYGGAILLAFASMIAFLLYQPQNKRHIIIFSGFFILTTAIAYLSLPASPTPLAQNISTRVVSLNYDQASGRPPNATQRLGRYVRLSRDAQEQLLVWPESSADEHITTFAPVLRRRLNIKQDQSQGRDLLLGAREQAGDARYNVLFQLSQDKHAYRKRKLVPFTEYIPGTFFKSLFDSLNLSIKNNDILAAPPQQTGFVWRDHFVYPLLCYEIAYPELLSETRRPGFIVNAGNESWFATPAVRRGTLRQARARSRESGLFVVRAITGGYSGFIDPYGEHSIRYDAHRSFTSVPGQVKLYPANHTFHARWSPWLAIVLILLFALLTMLTEMVLLRLQAKP